MLHQDQDEDQVLAGKLDLGEGETRQRGDEELADQNHGDKQESVEKVSQPGRTGPGNAEVVERPGRRNVEVHCIRRRMEGSPEGEDQGRDPDQGEKERAERLEMTRERAHW